MTRNLLIVLSVVLFAGTAIAEDLDLVWSNLIGEIGYCMVRDVAILDDGVVVAATNGDELDDFSADLWIDKYDFDGNLQWRTQISHAHPTARLIGYGIDEAPNGNIVAIAPAIVGPENANSLIAKLAPDGTLLDTLDLDFGYHERGLDIEVTDTGHLIACGWAYHYPDLNDAGQDGWMTKINPQGEVEWMIWLGAPNQQDHAWSIEALSDGNYAAAGRTWWTGGAGGRDAVIWKVSPDGELLWFTTYGGPDKDHIYEFQETPDGGFIGAGKTESFDAGDTDQGDAWLLRFDPDGNFMWRSIWGDTALEFGRSVDLTSDGGYIMAGVTFVPGLGLGNQYLLAKADADGNWIYAHYDGGADMEDLWAVREMSPGKYIAGGFTKSFGPTERTALVMRLDETTAVPDPTHNEPRVQALGSVISPNPMVGSGSVTLTLPNPDRVTVMLYDLLGRQVQTVHQGELRAGDHVFSLATNNLASGNYFLHIANERQVLSVQRLTITK